MRNAHKSVSFDIGKLREERDILDVREIDWLQSSDCVPNLYLDVWLQRENN